MILGLLMTSNARKQGFCLPELSHSLPVTPVLSAELGAAVASSTCIPPLEAAPKVADMSAVPTFSLCGCISNGAKKKTALPSGLMFPWKHPATLRYLPKAH